MREGEVRKGSRKVVAAKAEVLRPAGTGLSEDAGAAQWAVRAALNCVCTSSSRVVARRDKSPPRLRLSCVLNRLRVGVGYDLGCLGSLNALRSAKIYITLLLHSALSRGVRVAVGQGRAREGSRVQRHADPWCTATWFKVDITAVRRSLGHLPYTPTRASRTPSASPAPAHFPCAFPRLGRSRLRAGRRARGKSSQVKSSRVK